MVLSTRDFKVKNSLATNGITCSYVEKTSAYTITAQDYLINCTANTFDVTLPTAVGCVGKIYVVKNSGSGVITVKTTASQTIDGASTITVNQYETIAAVSTGMHWVLQNKDVADTSSAVSTSTTNFNGVLTSNETTVQSALDKLDDHTHTGLTSLGTVTTGTWNANLIAGQYGGTGVNNTGKTITLGGNLTTSGAYALTLTLSNTTSVTLPTSGTLATTGNLSQFSSTTSSQLATLISDETGTDKLVFNTSPTFVTSVVTSSASFDVFNTTATTVNFAGAATTLAIGAATGTATINNATVTLANAATLNMNGANPTVASTATGTLTLFNTNLLTVNAFGAATSMTIGGTPTGSTTFNFATNATTTGNTKAINIGTAGASGSTNNISIGSASSGTGYIKLQNSMIEHGSGDGTATPVAVTLRGSDGSGSNIAGVNMTIMPGNGTGTGGSGSLIFQTAPAAASSSTANTMATRLTLDKTGLATFANDVTISGVLRDTVTVNSQSDSYTLVLTDRGKMVECTKATANNLTVPLNSSVAFPVGTRIDILQVGAGQVTVVATGGVTVNGTPGLKLRAQWSSATLIKRATDTWVVVGDLSA